MFLGIYTWLLFMIPPLIFMIYAQAKVNSAFKKYSRVANMRRVTLWMKSFWLRKKRLSRR